MNHQPNIFERWSGVKADYEIAQSNRIKRSRSGVTGIAHKADYHYRNWSLFARAMEIARDIDRNDMVVGQGITRCVNNIVQDGISLSARTGNREIDDELEDWWRTVTEDESFSSTGEFTFNQMEKLVCRSEIVDGDILAVPLENDTLHLYEAHRLRTPYNTRRNVVHGILFDDIGRPLEYWITKEDLNPTSALMNVTGPNGVETIPTRDPDGNRQVFHVFDPKRVTQHRGFTALAPIALPAGFHDDIQIAKLVQQQSASMFAILRERNKDAKYKPPAKKGETREETLEDGTIRTIEGVSYGIEVTAQPGETLKGFSPNIPNPEFFQHALMTLQIIAINLDLPLIVFLLDGTMTNFTGWRGAWDQAKTGLRSRQRLLVSKFHRPVYLWKLRNLLARNPELQARVKAAAADKTFDVFRHEWSPESWPYIQPVDDSTANVIRVHSLQCPPRDIARENGYDWRRGIVEPAIEDNVYAWTKAIEAARVVNAMLQGKDEEAWKISPRDALVLPLAEKMNFSISRTEQTGEEPQPAAPAKAGGNGKPKSDQPILDFLADRK